MIDLHDSAKFRVKIRRDIGKDVRPNAEQLDGKVYEFTASWIIEPDESYPGEVAMISRDPNYPEDAPAWIASGDMVGVYKNSRGASPYRERICLRG